jgi:hypothetical protein
VRIGDGCATVTGYELPEPLVSQRVREGGSEVQARSQDTGLAVLVVAGKVESGELRVESAKNATARLLSTID